MSDTPIAKKSFTIAFLMFLAVLIGVNGLQLRGALRGFDNWTGHEDHRLPNVRLVSRSCRWAVIDRFIELQPVQNADAFIFGDSQMFARGAAQEEIFYTHWLGSDAIVINFAFLAAPISDMNSIAKTLNNKNIHAKRALLNLNISHFIFQDLSREENRQKPPSQNLLLPKRPKSFQNLYQNRYACAFKMRKQFKQEKLRTPRYRKLLEKFKHNPLPKYFIDFDPEYFADYVPSFTEEFVNVADQTILFGAPLAYDQLDHYNFDVAYVNAFSSSLIELCNDHAGQLTCPDFTRSITSEGFMDLIHMNAVGHKKLGQLLKKELGD